MNHTPLRDTSISVLTPYYDNPENHSPHNIELDCPPGGTRPWHLIHGIIEGTGLELSRPETDDDHSFTWMGAARYDFPNSTCEQWEKAHRKVKGRIERLYHSGAIRHGSW